MNGLQIYTKNKILSLGLIIALILVSYIWLGNTPEQWQFLLICLIGFGYGHFIIGFVYQIKSFFRKPKPWLQVTTFSILALLSLLVVEFLFQMIGYALALFIGFAYFLLHGLFNEQTLIQRQVKVLVPLPYILSLALFVFTLLAYTVPDPTFLFNRALQFADVNQFVFLQSFSNMGISLEIFPFIFWGGVIVSFAVLLLSWFYTRWHKLTQFLFVLYICILLLTVMFGAVQYVYMYLIVVGYHFMTWFFYYFHEMRKRTYSEFLQFSLLHVAVLTPFLLAGLVFFSGWESNIVNIMFDYKYFVIATYIHISVSFMNDEWFQNLQVKLFSFLN